MIGNLIRGYILYLISRGVSLNENKIKILEFLQDNKDKEISIFDISNKLKIDYKNTYRYIKQFENSGAVILKPHRYDKGKKVLVSIKPLKE